MNDPSKYPYAGTGGTYQAPVDNGDLNPAAYAIFKVVGGEFIPIFP